MPQIKFEKSCGCGLFFAGDWTDWTDLTDWTEASRIGVVVKSILFVFRTKQSTAMVENTGGTLSLQFGAIYVICEQRHGRNRRNGQNSHFRVRRTALRCVQFSCCDGRRRTAWGKSGQAAGIVKNSEPSL